MRLVVCCSKPDSAVYQCVSVSAARAQLLYTLYYRLTTVAAQQQALVTSRQTAVVICKALSDRCHTTALVLQQSQRSALVQQEQLQT
jgi:hypothetical protein